MKTINTTVKSKRNTDIPVTVVDSETSNPGLVIFAHGFKAERHEGGRFTEVAERLAEVGINSIRMGFPGCDESKEDFFYYSLTNDLDDIESCYEYMLDTYNINREHLGMIGYSMGGRLTSLFIDTHPEIKTIGFWAGACLDYHDNDDFLGGNIIEMRKEANENGFVDFLNYFDNDRIKLSKQFIDDMDNMDTKKGLNMFDGSAIVVHGTEDTSVDIKVSDFIMDNMTNARNKKKVIVEGANHGFGLWDNHPEQSQILVNETVEFFKQYL